MIRLWCKYSVYFQHYFGTYFDYVFKAVKLEIHLLTMHTKVELGTVCWSCFQRLAFLTQRWDMMYVQSLSLSVGDHSDFLTRAHSVYLNTDLSDVNHVFPVDAYHMTTNTILWANVIGCCGNYFTSTRFPHHKPHSSHLWEQDFQWLGF